MVSMRNGLGGNVIGNSSNALCIQTKLLHFGCVFLHLGQRVRFIWREHSVDDSGGPVIFAVDGVSDRLRRRQDDYFEVIKQPVPVWLTSSLDKSLYSFVIRLQPASRVAQL